MKRWAWSGDARRWRYASASAHCTERRDKFFSTSQGSRPRRWRKMRGRNTRHGHKEPQHVQRDVEGLVHVDVGDLWLADGGVELGAGEGHAERPLDPRASGPGTPAPPGGAPTPPPEGSRPGTRRRATRRRQGGPSWPAQPVAKGHRGLCQVPAPFRGCATNSWRNPCQHLGLHGRNCSDDAPAQPDLEVLGEEPGLVPHGRAPGGRSGAAPAAVPRPVVRFRRRQSQAEVAATGGDRRAACGEDLAATSLRDARLSARAGRSAPRVGVIRIRA